MLLAIILCTANLHINNDVYRVSEYIRTISPQTDAASADRIASSIVVHASNAHVDPYLIAAILRQESNFRPFTKACGYHKKYNRQFCDYGVGQINDIWVRHWSLDKTALLYNDDYNIEIVTRVLVEARRVYEYQEDWYGNYHDNRAEIKARWVKSVNNWLRLANRGNEPMCMSYGDINGRTRHQTLATKVDANKKDKSVQARADRRLRILAVGRPESTESPQSND